LRNLIILILIYLIYRIVRSLLYPPFKKGYRKGMGKTSSSITDEMVKDPCCQVYLPKREALSEKIGNEWYFFCGEECCRKYKEKTKNQ